ncbi:MAG: AmmeMemoRadiSam system protein B [Candidatus Brocadia sinica]|nr:AmmeMemoRadiSam system protein B [Candidatus Brocadia sinica]NUO04432.1 AmmeMemoRadiSam system protein B [Candidatus Brocadia sinica]
MKTSRTFGILSIALLTSSVLLAQTEPGQVWEPQVAGRFYPGNEIALKDQINAFFKNVSYRTPKKKPFALISPHAGYQYSGQVAAYGYNALKDSGFTRVIILSPSHFRSGKRFRGVSILNAKNIKTPLGLIPIDLDACKQLLDTSKDSSSNVSRKPAILFGSYEGAYQGEHSMETQLPFLQMALNTFKLVPIMVGILIEDDFERVANALQPLIDDKTIVVVSSDFTHYGEGYGYIPFRKDIEKNIKALDYGAFDKILNKDFEGLKTYRKETGINACGIMPIELLLKLLPDNASGEILNYDTSGHQSRDFSFSVSYASILFTKSSEVKSGLHIPLPQEKTSISQQSLLTSEEKALLLSLARNTLETYTKTGTSQKLDHVTDKLPLRLKEKYGVFVTLKKSGELRGCIGHILPRTSLFQGVIENTINSSSNDRRFPPVDAKEVSDITIEISVLSPLEKIHDPVEFMVGKDGIIIRKGPASAVFLPQVAVEQGWGRAETLCHLCQKAGLSRDAWKEDGMEFYIFTADVFHEGDRT